MLYPEPTLPQFSQVHSCFILRMLVDMLVIALLGVGKILMNRGSVKEFQNT